MFKDLTGQRFGRMQVQERVESNTRSAKWRCLCDCGNYKIKTSYSLKTSESCGCLQREKAKNICKNREYVSIFTNELLEKAVQMLNTRARYEDVAKELNVSVSGLQPVIRKKNIKLDVTPIKKARDSYPEEARRKISETKTGKKTGVFYGYRKWPEHLKAKLKGRGKKEYPILKCKNPECGADFQLTSKNPYKVYCSRPCMSYWTGKNSVIGNHNKCKWYTFNSSIAGIVKLQGTWELRFAVCLDKLGRTWRANHNKDKFPYKSLDGKFRTYNPDFYSGGEYYDVKGYFDEKAKHKINEIQNSGIKINLIFWEDLVKLETELFGKSLGGQVLPNDVLNSMCMEIN